MSDERHIRVLIADDHPLFRSGLAYEIGRREGLELVGQAADGLEALALARELAPDVVVLDVRMPHLGGARAIEALAAAGVRSRVLVLSAFRDRQAVYDAVRAGAKGYLPKDADREDVCDAIEAVAAGQTVIDEPLRRALVADLQMHGDRPAPQLSPRELEVLTLTATGMSAPEVGRRLYIAAATVKTHLHRIYQKLGVSDRTAMVAEAMRRGLIE